MGFLVATAVAVSIFCAPASPVDKVGADEFRVYNALLNGMHFKQKEPRVLIFNETLNLKCGPDSGNPILMNGCSGLTMPPDTPEDVGQFLQEKFPGMKDSTWADFRKRNAATIRLTDGFVTPWKHKLVGPGITEDPKDTDSYDCGFYLSQVGFSEQRTEAVLFAFLASYRYGVPSTGHYFLLQTGADQKWEVKYQFQYFSTARDAESENGT